MLVFLSILEAGSFLRAAESLGYTHSGLLYIVNALEEDLGLKLFVRGRTGISLTREGEQIIPLLRSFCDAEKNLRQEIEKIIDLKHDVLRIGAYNSVARSWLPRLISGFSSESRLEVFASHPETLYAQLLGNKLDLLFTGSCEEYPHEFLPLRKDYFLGIFPPGFDNKGRDYFPITDFENMPFIMPSFGKDIHTLETLAKHGVTPKTTSVLVDDATAIGMVNNGMGATMLPQLVMEGNKYDVQIFPIRPAEYRLLGIAVRSFEALSPLAKEFIAYVKEYDDESGVSCGS